MKTYLKVSSLIIEYRDIIILTRVILHKYISIVNDKTANKKRVNKNKCKGFFSGITFA